MSNRVDQASLGALVDGHLPRVLVQNHGLAQGPGVVTSEIGLHPNWLRPELFEDPMTGPQHLENLRGLVRAGFAADPFLHPQQRSPHVPPDRPFTESAVQQVALHELGNLYRLSTLDDAAGNGYPARASRIGLMAPGGLGKTFMSAKFMSQVFQAEKVVVVVDNNDILDQAREDYAREFGLRIGSIQSAYANNSQRRLDPSSRIVFINRTMLNKRWDDVVDWIGSSRTGWVFDEAHHLGRGVGAQEFREIFRRFNTDPRMLAHIAANRTGQAQYLGLLTSATFWHGDEELITNPEFLGVRNLQEGQKPYGKIYGPLLYNSESVITNRGLFGPNQTRSVDLGTEVQCLREGLAIPEIARRQLLRAMGQGHLARLSHSDLHNDEITGPDGQSSQAFEVVTSIDNRSVKIERTTIAYNLLERVYERLVGMRVHTQGDIASALSAEEIATLAEIPNRTLILVRRTEVANEVREVLKEIAAAHGDARTEIRAVHSRPGSDNREDSLAWFRDKEPYETADERTMNKILIVDQMINEGVDVPKTNAVVLLRSFNAGDEGSIRRLIQIITRASRTSEFKTHVEVIDFSGATARLRDVLNIGTQAYGGGGISVGGVGTQIEVEIRPGNVRENIERVSFINAQPVGLTPFADEIDRWLVANAPFDDLPVEGDASHSSPLAVQLLSLIHTIPAREVRGGYSIFNFDALKQYKDNRLKEMLSSTGPRLIAVYEAMKDLYLRFRVEGLEEPSIDVAKVASLLDVQTQLRTQWFELLEISRHLDFYHGREVTLNFSPRHGDPAGDGVHTIAAWMAYAFNLEKLSLTQPGDLAVGNMLRIVGPPKAGAGRTWQLVAQGENAYSFLAGELGTHVLNFQRNGHRYRNYVFARVTPPLDTKDPLRNYVDEEHKEAERLFRHDPEQSVRRVYGGESIRRDKEIPSLEVPLLRIPEEGGTIEMRESDEVYSQLGRMLRMNHYNYIRSTIQDLVLPAILAQRGGG